MRHAATDLKVKAADSIRSNIGEKYLILLSLAGEESVDGFRYDPDWAVFDRRYLMMNEVTDYAR